MDRIEKRRAQEFKEKQAMQQIYIALMREARADVAQKDQQSYREAMLKFKLAEEMRKEQLFPLTLQMKQAQAGLTEGRLAKMLSKGGGSGSGGGRGRGGGGGSSAGASSGATGLAAAVNELETPQGAMLPPGLGMIPGVTEGLHANQEAFRNAQDPLDFMIDATGAVQRNVKEGKRGGQTERTNALRLIAKKKSGEQDLLGTSYKEELRSKHGEEARKKKGRTLGITVATQEGIEKIKAAFRNPTTGEVDPKDYEAASKAIVDFKKGMLKRGNY
jgi:hypothetical protein